MNRVLKIAAAIWTLQFYPSRGKEWNVERKVDEILRAGFDGVAASCLHPAARIASRRSIYLVGGHDFAHAREVRDKLKQCRDLGVIHVNCQICNHDTPLKKALAVAIRIMEVAERLNLKAAIEVHRDTYTETPEKVYALANAYRKSTGKMLRLNFDHSHPAIIKHLSPEHYWKRLGIRLDLLRYGEMIHLRPFNGHHCQIPVTNGNGRLGSEFKAWLPFCERVLQVYASDKCAGRDLIVVPELGPRIGDYGLFSFPDVWADAKVLANRIRSVWSSLLTN